MSTFRLAQANESHLDSILAIEEKSNPAPWSDSSFKHEFTNEQGLFKVALKDGEVVGYSIIWFVIDEAHITTLAVRPDQRREKIGQQLAQDLLLEAKDRGMMCATLEVRADNKAAIGLYEKFGFQTISVRKGYYPNDHTDALVMWLYNLNSWEPPKN